MSGVESSNATLPQEPLPGSLQSRLSAAIQLHQAGQLPEAEQAYRQLLAEFPADANVAHFLGLVCFQHGAAAEGLALVQQSLESDPANPHAWNNLGNMYNHLHRREDARKAYLCATRIGVPAAAAWYNLSLIYLREHKVEEALGALREATRAGSGFVDALQTLAFVYYRLGRSEDAYDVYKQWAAEAPDDPTPRHMLAAASGQDVPARADDRYIVKTFNRFAESFDEKLRRLEYRAPQLVAASLIHHPLYQTGRAVVLDAGCGTGLCGALLKSTASRLVGVDLSPKMLEQARDRGVYDEVHVGELTSFMGARPAQFDIVVAADVLCYFGELQTALQAVRLTLRPGGILSFSVEALLDGSAHEDFRIRLHGRYSHARSYVERALECAGFAAPHIDPAVLRKEFDEPVHGFIVLAELPVVPK
jgi:predicted TPR repeat methyltransferase